QTSLVAHQFSRARPVTTTPAERSGAYLARFPNRSGLPRYCGESASASAFSRPAQCSLTLRPARIAALLTRASLEVLQTICRLLVRSKCFRPEREWPGGVHTHRTRAPSTRHTQQCCRALTTCDCPRSQELSLCRFGCRRRARRDHLLATRYGEAQRHRSGSLSAPRARAYRRAPDQSGGCFAAVEYRRTNQAITAGKLDGKTGRLRSICHSRS